MQFNSIYIVLTIGIIASFFGFVIPSFARSISTYDVTIPRQGAIVTGSLKKESAGKGVHNNSAIGGNKRINTSIRLKKDSSNITPSYNMGSGDRITLSYSGGGSSYNGSNTSLGIATPVTTTVKVAAQGSWSPDEK